MLPWLAASAFQANLLIDQGLAALGGENLLRSIRRTDAKLIDHTYLIEQSERPEGPYFANYRDGVEIADFQEDEVRFEGKYKGAQFEDWTAFGSDVRLGVPGDAFKPRAAEARWRLALGPERLLLLAKADSGRQAERPRLFHGRKHDVISFAWGKSRVFVLLNPVNHLPVCAEALQQGEGFFSIWGDVNYRVDYSGYEIEDNGVKFPTLWSLYRNGEHWSDQTITGVSFTIGGSREIADLAKETAQAARRRPVKLAPAKEIADGIRLIPGPWNTAVIDQGDGLVVVEGVIGSAYMEAAFQEFEREFPGRHIKALVSCSDSWPHLGGIRAAAARGIPIYCADANVPIVRRLLAAKFSLSPDAFAAFGKPGIVVPVGKETTLGSGLNRIVIAPIEGSVTERLVSIYVPGRKLLYASDTIQPMGNGKFFGPLLIAETRDLVLRRGWTIDQVWAMHAGPLPWTDVTKSVEAKP